MFDTALTYPKLVFLHIPKTAGQSVHNALAAVVGAEDVSPIRVHTQATQGQSQYPSGYRLYSGHLDWDTLYNVPNPRFVFSILRDPRERIASFYFYLLNEAKKLPDTELAKPQNAGKKKILELSADDYFFGGQADWHAFILDHYDNFYCRYFGSRKIRAGAEFSTYRGRRKLRLALDGLNDIDWVYSLERLDHLEADLKALFDFDVNLTQRFDNSGDTPRDLPKWPRLLQRLSSDATRNKLESFVALDMAFMEYLEF